MSVDILVFGPHADDIEIGLGGTVARHTAAGHRVGLCDLTRAELSSNGTPEQRQAEAAEAARVLGVAWRENLGWPDGGIAATPSMIRSAVDLIRRACPRTIAIPYWDDRHPDHAAASAVLRTAAFTSALRRFITDADPWRPDWVCYYFINDGGPASFVVDVSEHYPRKRAALDCYRSQFALEGARATEGTSDGARATEGTSDGARATQGTPDGARATQGTPDGARAFQASDEPVPTRLNTPTFRRLIESRDAQFGALAGVAFAEGIVVREPVQRPGLLKHTP